tara:strand:+ start:7441 stop:8994 length:1554 start_codon:yes stop_codon:yes gene_type:complete
MKEDTMREVTTKSVKLNRDLDKMLDQALERDLLVRIGWGKQGDEKPKNGEIGVITHLPEKSRVLLLGELGECAGAMNQGGTFTLQGSCTSMLGAFQENGRITVERDSGDRTGYRMSGGEIVIQGSTGEKTGSGLRGGSIIIRGHARSKCGTGMKGGSIIVLGNVGPEPGYGMTGGKIIVAGNCSTPGEGAMMRNISSEEIEEFSQILEPQGFQIDSDALVIVPTEDNICEEKIPKRTIIEGFENISLVPSSAEVIDKSTTLEIESTILPAGLNENGLLLPIPWIVNLENVDNKIGEKSTQPCLVSSNPKENDLLLIGEENIVGSSNLISNCSGIVLDLISLSELNDAEIEATLVSLYSRMRDDSLVFIRGSVSRVERIFRLVVDLDLDGAIIDVSTPGGNRAASSLPRIGLVSRAMNLSSQGRTIMIQINKTPTAEDLLIARGAGCMAIVSPPSEEKLELTIKTLNSSIRGWMRELGANNLFEINRSNLRAMDQDTAAISGLRLIGYDRPLPMWLKN